MDEAACLKFDVFLLMGMVCKEELKRNAIVRAGLTMDEAMEIRESIRPKVQFGPDQFANLAEILMVDVPADEHPVLSYRSVLWPGLDFVVMGQEGCWKSARFQRAEGEKHPILVNPMSVPVWGCTLDEVAGSFSAVEVGDSMPPYEELLFTAADGKRYGAGFSWGLLQDIERLA
ncbi:hypothetical protein ACFVAV_16465 [Nocardia sp. NPDC057663]|uniref:hypothetical protein n=1 Tax=Nocardia sp. NPDC057663 TaxID=3346201 RepID=UPI00366F0E84